MPRKLEGTAKEERILNDIVVFVPEEQGGMKYIPIAGRGGGGGGGGNTSNAEREKKVKKKR